MEKLQPTVERRRDYFVPANRASWGAIIGGTLIAIAVLSLMSTLGIAIGAATLDPATGDSPDAKTLGVGAGIWWLISGLLALGAGGWVAGYLSGMSRRREGAAHGLVTWALASLVSIALLSSVVGSMLSGGLRVVGTGMDAASSMNAPAWSRAAGKVLPEGMMPSGPQQVWSEARQALQKGQAGVPQDPAAATEQATARQELEVALARLTRSAQRGETTPAEREAVVKVLVERGDMSRDEAQSRVESWANTLSRQGGGAPDEQSQEELKEKGKEVAEAAANAVSGAAWWSFFYLLLTALAATAAAHLGAARHRIEQQGGHGQGERTSRSTERTTTHPNPPVPPAPPPPASTPPPRAS